MKLRIPYILGAAAAAALLIPITGMTRVRRPELRVAAAADLERAFREIQPRFEAESGAKLSLVFGSTGLLAKQVENGAPFDLLAAANEGYVRDLEARGKILPGSRRIYAIGRLAVWSPKEKVGSLRDLAAPRFRRIAIANPLHAPYGRAAREALERCGAWGAVESKVVYGENVMQALQHARAGSVDACIVARSLMTGSEGSFLDVPANLYTPLKQGLGIPSQSRNTELARKFARYLTEPEGRSVMTRHGFAAADSTD